MVLVRREMHHFVDKQLAEDFLQVVEVEHDIRLNPGWFELRINPSRFILGPQSTKKLNAYIFYHRQYIWKRGD